MNEVKIIYTLHFSIIKMVAFRVCEFYLNLKKNNSPLSHLEGIHLKQPYLLVRTRLREHRRILEETGIRTAECPRREPAEPLLRRLGLRGG